MLRIAQASDFDVQRALIFDFGTGKGQDAIRAVVRGVLGLSLETDEAERHSAGEQALTRGLVPAADAVFLDDLLDVAPSTDARALYDAMDNDRRNLGKRQALTTLIENVARQRPL
jgi:hypothetical protein